MNKIHSPQANSKPSKVLKDFTEDKINSKRPIKKGKKSRTNNPLNANQPEKQEQVKTQGSAQGTREASNTQTPNATSPVPPVPKPPPILTAKEKKKLKMEQEKERERELFEKNFKASDLQISKMNLNI